jgi:hypothetical protein
MGNLSTQSCTTLEDSSHRGALIAHPWLWLLVVLNSFHVLILYTELRYSDVSPRQTLYDTRTCMFSYEHLNLVPSPSQHIVPSKYTMKHGTMSLDTETYIIRSNVVWYDYWYGYLSYKPFFHFFLWRTYKSFA